MHENKILNGSFIDVKQAAAAELKKVCDYEGATIILGKIIVIRDNITIISFSVKI